MTRKTARLAALATLGMVLATSSWGTIEAQVQQSAQPIRIRKPEPTPTPTPQPDFKKVDLGLPGPPPPKVCLPGMDCSKKEEPKTPLPAAKPNESKDSVGDPAEIFKWVLTQPLQPQTFTWKVGDPPTLLPKVETHICLLTEVSGKFQGAGERVQLLVDKGASGGARYVLRGDGASGYVRAAAICAGREKFVPIADKENSAIAASFPERTFTSCPPLSLTMNKGSYPKRGPFLSVIGGKLNGGGEVVMAMADKNDERLRGAGCSGMVIGGVTSHGDQIWPLLRYRTQSSRTIDIKEATFFISNKQPEGDGALIKFLDTFAASGETFKVPGRGAWMIPVDEGLCGLTMLAGKFQGYGEAATITAEKNSDGRMWWLLGTTNNVEGGYLAAGARCIARDQRGGLLF